MKKELISFNNEVGPFSITHQVQHHLVLVDGRESNEDVSVDQHDNVIRG